MIEANFDPNDRSLIERAIATGQPSDVAEVFHHALDGFRRRLKASGIPHIDGLPRLMIFKPATVFDDLILRAVLQEWADLLGQPIELHLMPNPNKIGTPDVKFV